VHIVHHVNGALIDSGADIASGEARIVDIKGVYLRGEFDAESSSV